MTRALWSTSVARGRGSAPARRTGRAATTRIARSVATRRRIPHSSQQKGVVTLVHPVDSAAAILIRCHPASLWCGDGVARLWLPLVGIAVPNCGISIMAPTLPRGCGGVSVSSPSRSSRGGQPQAVPAVPGSHCLADAAVAPRAAAESDCLPVHRAFTGVVWGWRRSPATEADWRSIGMAVLHRRR